MRTGKKNAGIMLAVLIMAIDIIALGEATLLPALANRSTIHSGYNADAIVPEHEISLLLQAAASMPTGGDQRSLEFFAVTDREEMQTMKKGNPWSQALDSAPLVIVVAANDSEAIYPELQEMDAGLAAGAILAQATELGYSTCVLSISPQPERIASTREALNLGEEIMPVLMVAVGLPDVDAVSSASVAGE